MYSYARMDVWPAGWLAGWLAGWVVGWVGGGWLDGWMDGWLAGWVGWMDGWMYAGTQHESMTTLVGLTNKAGMYMGRQQDCERLVHSLADAHEDMKHINLLQASFQATSRIDPAPGTPANNEYFQPWQGDPAMPT